MANRSIQAVRRYNRFYTRQMGILDSAFLDSPYTLSEVRVMYEIAHGANVTAKRIGSQLGLDQGYLSRIVQKFEGEGLIRREKSSADRRSTFLELTAKGRKAFGVLDRRQDEKPESLLANVRPPQQRQLISAMKSIEHILRAAVSSERPIVRIRPHRPSDVGWVIFRQAQLYSEEYRYDGRYEGLVAEVLGKFLSGYDEEHERGWIAELDTEIAGSLFLTRKSATVAALRILYVEPWARGAGIGARLVEESIRFARGAGYRKLTLWKQKEQTTAERLYIGFGFEKVSQEVHRRFTERPLTAETWQLKL